MTNKIRKGLPFSVDLPFVGEDGTQYPAGWLANATSEELAAHGITEVAEHVFKDSRYYYNSQGPDGTVISTEKPLDNIKKTINDKITEHRDMLMHTGGIKVIINGVDKWVHSDTFSRSQHIAMRVFGSNLPTSILWKTMDGTFIAMTQSVVEEIFAAGVSSDINIFTVSEQHKSSVNALTTIDELIAYDWTSGWPEVYVPDPEL